MSTLPTDSAERKAIPLASGCFDYFPAALAEVAKLSRVGNEKHNPGKPLFWNRPLSNDHPDTLLRHFLERGTVDTDGMRHSVKVAWRALAILQLELEAAGEYPVAQTPRPTLDNLVGSPTAADALAYGLGVYRRSPDPAEADDYIPLEKFFNERALDEGKTPREPAGWPWGV